MTNPITGCFRGAVLISVASLAMLSAAGLTSPTAHAQDQAAADDDTTVEEIVVTGSRIRQSPFEARTPVQIYGDEDIDRSGQVSIADFLQRLPITGSAINRNNNSSGNLGFPPDGSGIGAGASQIDLRNLTSKRTLVLVDGKRWINGSSASGVSAAVDLNTIPVRAIKRIEILQDGASPIYGSDAIAGVVNIITRDDFDGFEAHAYGGAYKKGDGVTQEYDVSFGAAGDRTRVFLNVNFVKQDLVSAGDRKISEFPVAGAGMCLATCSSGTPQGRFVFIDPNTGETLSITLNDGVLNDGMGNIPAFDTTLATGDFHAFQTADRFNFQPFNHLVTPNKRTSIFGKAEVDLTDNILFRAVGTYTNRKSQNQAAPEPLFIGPGAGGGGIADTISIDVTNPFNPFGFSLDDDNFIFAGRRPIEAGPRIFNQNVDSWVITGTLEGETAFANRSFFWDMNITWSQAQANQVKFGAFNALKLKQALGPLDGCVDAATGAGINGCVPFNFFGGQGPDGTGSITPEMLDFVGFIQKDESQQQLFSLTFNVSGDAFDLPAGPVAYAFGYEHRRNEGFFIPSPVVSSGETAGVLASPTAGKFNVDEAYGEINVPLLANMPLVDILSVNGAFRVSDYDLFGTDAVFKAGVNWRVSGDLLFRFNFAEGFRAPSIGELFNSGSRFDSTLNDPCSNVATQPANIQANCAALGVPANFAQTNFQIGVNTGGSLDLMPETSDSFTIGLVYDVGFLKGQMGLEKLVFEANWYRIELNDAIQAVNAQTQLDLCVTTLDPAFCDGITRFAGVGNIIRFENQLTNIGGINTDGFDWTITATSVETSFGGFTLTWLGNVVTTFDEFVAGSGGLVKINRKGQELGSPERGFVKFKSTIILDHNFRDWTSSVIFRHIGSLQEACPGFLFDLGVEDLCSNPSATLNTIPSVNYVDVQVNWVPGMFDGRVALTLGVNNLFAANTPVCFTCDLNSFDGTVHQIPGQFGYIRLGLSL